MSLLVGILCIKGFFSDQKILTSYIGIYVAAKYITKTPLSSFSHAPLT